MTFLEQKNKETNVEGLFWHSINQIKTSAIFFSVIAVQIYTCSVLFLSPTCFSLVPCSYRVNTAVAGCKLK